MKEYQKIINLLENTPNQPSKFRTKNFIDSRQCKTIRSVEIEF